MSGATAAPNGSALSSINSAAPRSLQARRIHLGCQPAQGRLRFIDDARIILGLAKFNQFHIVGEIALDVIDRLDAIFEPVALAHDRLRVGRVVPKAGFLGKRIQLVKFDARGIIVKGASSTARRTA